MHLNQLPETMHLNAGESYGPLSKEQLERLHQSVLREFPARGNGRFGIARQEWDGLYIDQNSGASRRFALLRRLAPHREIDVEVTPYSLERSWRQNLCEQQRFIGVTDDPQVCLVFNELKKWLPLFGWITANSHLGEKGAAFMVLPPALQAPSAAREVLQNYTEKWTVTSI